MATINLNREIKNDLIIRKQNSVEADKFEELRMSGLQLDK